MSSTTRLCWRRTRSSPRTGRLPSFGAWSLCRAGSRRCNGGEQLVGGECAAVGRGGNARLIRHRLDVSHCLRRLRVSHNLSSLGIYPREVLVIALARFENVLLGVVGRVILASDPIVDMLTEVGGVGPCRITGFDAKRTTTHEAVKVGRKISNMPGCENTLSVLVPLGNLLVRVIVTVTTGECVGIHKTAERITTLSPKSTPAQNRIDNRKDSLNLHHEDRVLHRNRPSED
jgi:hypothetical protein